MSFLLYIYWNIDPRIIPPWTVPRWYGVCWATGLMGSFLLMNFIYKKEGKSEQEVSSLAVYVILGALIGARLGHILFYDPVYYWENPIEILPVQLKPRFRFTGLAGLASHGGAIGILIAVFMYCRKKKESFLWVLDRLAIVAAFTGGLIRLGNLMNSEMIGRAASVPWAFVFARVDQVPRHPAQLYESLCYFLISFLLFRLWKIRREKMRRGYLLGWFLALLFTCRFIIEFFKIDQSAFEAGMLLNMGQLLSIPFILLGLGLIWKGGVLRPSG